MTLRRRIRTGKTILGSWVNTASPIVAEIMAGAGFDFLAVDAEHSAVDVPGAQAMFQAIAAANPDCAPLVRLPGNDYAVTKRYLDAGASGVIVPLVNSADEAREAVRSVKYPPDGDRGVGFGRSHGYGFNFDDYMSRANDETVCVVQIEHIKAVKSIDEILSVEGVDAAFVGPYDLSASMGITANFDHPDYRAALGAILEACRKHGIAPGIHVVQPDPSEVARLAGEGYRLIAYSLDITMLGTACREGLKASRALLESES